jgi:hypothetical protein
MLRTTEILMGKLSIFYGKFSITTTLGDKNMQPRLIRLRDVPAYLGMDKNRFNKEIRPFLTVIPIGNRGIAFDRLDLDNWVDHYKQRNGRPVSNERRQVWDENIFQGCRKLAGFGTSIRESTTAEFAKALEQVTSKKQKSIL